MAEKEVMRTLKVGTKMGGYQLLGLIARGGMGAVYEALEIALDRRVALKVIAPPNPEDHDAEELVQRFLQEARTLARVNHPNVITIYAIDTFEGVPFITMELVEGISFKELLAVSFLSADLATPMFIQMLEGLQCLHANRIVHRDLKPHNLMVRKDGQVKILDFGIAKPSDSGNFTHVGVVVGSLAYMAPEVKLGIAATERSDLWNMGAIFYECLTGKALPKVMAENPSAKDVPYATNSPIPFEMRAIIAKLCHHRPLERYENCEQVIEDLKAFQRKRTPVTPDVMQAFGRKVEEILAKSRNDSRDMPSKDITPVQAAVLPVDAPATIEGYRDRPFTPRDRKKGKTINSRYVGVGLLLVILVALILLKSKPEESVTVDPPKPPPVAAVTADPKPLVFNPPTRTEPKLKPTELVAPAADETLQLEPSAIPTLTWSRELMPGEYVIQISTDRAFRKILVDEPVSGTSYRPAHVLQEGNFYWRLMPKSAAGDPVGPLRFTLAHLKPIEPRNPADGASFELGAKEKSVNVEFSWKCKVGTESYQIQIAAAPKYLSRENATTDCSWHEKALPTGQYRWRVRAMNGIWSDSREFTVAKKTAPPLKVVPMVLAKPDLDESADQFTMKFKGSPRDLASAAKSIVDFPELRWKPVAGARGYLLQIAADQNFNKKIVEEKLSTTEFQWKTPVPGNYHWRVAATADKQGEFSDPARLEVQLPAPKLKPKYRFEALLEGDRQVVNWPFVPMAEKYLVQFGPKRNLANVEPQVSAASKFSLPRKHGQYFIRVATANAEGKALGPYSEVAAVSVDPVATLETPKPKFPKSASSVVVRKGRTAINFEWSKIAKADRYLIELSKDQDFSEVFEKITAQDHAHVLKKLERTGRVYWRVRAESRAGVSAWCEPLYFDAR